MRPIHSWFLRAAAGLVCCNLATAQMLITVNDTRDLADGDLLDGVVDAEVLVPGQQRTLRAAIEQACSWGGAFRIVLPAQTLVLSRFGADELCHWGDLDIFSAGAGLSQMVIEGTPGLSVLDASGFGVSSSTADRVFDVQPSVGAGAQIVIRNVRLQFGLRPGASFAGGGIQHRGGALLELENVDIVSCSSGNGGGIYAGGPLSMTDGSLAQCSASIDGGGLFVAAGASATLWDVDVNDNAAAQYGGGAALATGAALSAGNCFISMNDALEGGGVRSRGALTLTQTALIGNIAAGGTGSGGNVSLRDSQSLSAPSTLGMGGCTLGAGSAANGAGLFVGLNTTANVFATSFELNVATALGGGLCNQGTATVDDSTFSDNEASSGGGAHNFRTLALKKCTVSANRASQNGGGLNLSGLNGARCTIDACTIAGNRALDGGGVYRDGQFGAPVVEIKNTLLAENRRANTGQWQNSAGTYPFASSGFNVDTDGTCALGAGSHAGTIAFPLYAGLGPLQSNGGPTRTHALLYCSAAHCRGDVAHMDGTNNDYDQRGFLRDLPRDVGAFDSPVLTLTPYCTAGTTSSGCVPSISAQGMFYASAPCTLQIDVHQVEGQKQGVIFYGVSGPSALPWGPGSTSWLCVKSPTQRTGAQNSGGAAGACNGSFQLAFGSWLSTHPGALGAPFVQGTTIYAQAWFRDPPAPKTTNLSDAIAIPMCP
jgi:hypothetical protein